MPTVFQSVSLLVYTTFIGVYHFYWYTPPLLVYTTFIGIYHFYWYIPLLLVYTTFIGNLFYWIYHFGFSGAKEFVSNADEFVEAFRRQKHALSSGGGIRDEQLAARARQHFRRSWINLDRVRRGMPSLGNDAGHTVEVEAVAVPSQEMLRGTFPRMEVEASTKATALQLPSNYHSSFAYHHY
jgi:hypothetical protein